jgi:hypothetical protein
LWFRVLTQASLSCLSERFDFPRFEVTRTSDHVRWSGDNAGMLHSFENRKLVGHPRHPRDRKFVFFIISPANQKLF